MAAPSYTPPKLFNETPREQYSKQWTALKVERERFESVHEDLTDFILPFLGRRREHESRRNNYNSRKNRVRPVIINNKATIAHRTLVNNLMGGLTSPARPWLKVSIGDPDLERRYDVKLWQQGATKAILYIAAISNYYNAQRTTYRDLVIYGTGPKIIDEHPDTVICAHNVPNGSYVMDVDSYGKPNRLMHEIEMSCENIVERFGYDRCSHMVKWAYDRGDYYKIIPLMRVIEPNKLFTEGKYGLRGMKFASVYYEVACDNDHKGLLGLKGYNDQPFSGPRWDLLDNDIYGISPGMETIGDVKGLQILEQRKAQAIDKQVDPPTQGPASTRNMRVNGLPGKHTAVADGNGGIRSLYEVKPDMISLSNEIARHEQRIARAFYEDVLYASMGLGDTPNVKARQIDEIHEEKMLAFGPVLERTFTELLDVDVKRIFEVGVRAGIIKPPPDILRNKPIKVVYTSPFAQLQKAIGIGNIERSLQFTGQVAAVYPEAADRLNPDAVIDEYAEAIGSPASIMRDDAEVEKIRQSREQKQTAAALQQQVIQGVETAKTASEAKLTDPNMLSYLIGGAR